MSLDFPWLVEDMHAHSHVSGPAVTGVGQGTTI